MPDLKKLITLEALQAALPSWLKSSSKPSYTQDEVTDGTTYKRVKSTEKSAWDNKQNALTTTQMNAVNSGATQAKIDQIHYNTNNGVKNVLEFDTIGIGSTISDSFVTGGVRFTRNSDNSITVTRESSNTNSAYCVFILDSASVRIDSLCDNDHYLIGCPTGGGSSSFELLAGTINARDYGSGVLLPTLSSGQSNIIPQIVVRPAFTGTITFKPMIITKATYNAGFTDYQPYALPNTAITPALVEEIDAGAKNDLDTSVTALKALTSNTEGTWNGNVYTVANVGTVTVNADNSLTVVKTGTSARLIFRLTSTNTSGTKYANMVLSGCPANGSDETYNMIAELSVSPYTNLAKDYGSGGVISSSSSNMYIYLQLKASYTTGSGGITFKPMVCTLADWKVSQKFVPYRPDLDLIYSSLKCDVKYAKVPVSTSYSLIGSIKTKGNRVCRITVTQEYASVAPTGLILSKSNQSSDFNTLTNRVAPPVETTTDDITLTISALCYYTYDRVVYIWAKAKTASTNGNNFMALCEHFGDIDGVKNSMN